MSEGLTVTAMESSAEFYGVDGDGLGEGEIISEADIEESSEYRRHVDTARRRSVYGRH